MWDGRVTGHVGSEFYDVDGFVGGRDRLRDFELEDLGPVEGLDLVHLQCHFGLDTLSWARRGAQVTSLDFSGEAVEAARQVAGRVGIEARFVPAAVYDAGGALGETYDKVYTGIGAFTWFPDIERWATVVFDDALSTYTDVDSDAFAGGDRVWEWQHPLSDVVSALTGVGLHLEFLQEHDVTLYGRMPSLIDTGGIWEAPPSMPRMPFIYSLVATRPSWSRRYGHGWSPAGCPAEPTVPKTRRKRARRPASHEVSVRALRARNRCCRTRTTLRYRGT
jgi:hypothetical protein